MDIKVRELYEKGKKKMSGNYQDALEIFIQVRDKAIEEYDEKLLGEVLLDMCLLYRNLSDSLDGFKTSDCALKCYEKLNNIEGQARANNYLGIFCFYSGLYQQALNYFTTAEKMIKDENYPKLYISILSNIGEVYKEAANFDYAMSYYEKAKTLTELHQIVVYQKPILTNIGDLHLKFNNLNKAMDYFMEALSYTNASDDSIFTGELLSKIGVVHMNNGSFDTARNYFYQAKKRFQSANNNYYLMDTLIQLYDLEVLSESDGALSILEQAEKLAVFCNADKKLAEIDKRFHNYYISIGEYKKALEHFTSYHYLIAKTDSYNLIHKLEILKLEYELVNKMPPNDMLNEIIESQSMRSKNIVDLLKKQNSLLERQANYDTLTNIPNRRSINKKLESLTNPDIGKCHALIMIDIDHFKWVNDGMGHAYGDVCLKKISNLLLEATEKVNGFVGRYGGEEFICILENVDLDSVCRTAEQLREEIENANISYTYEEKQHKITISIGYKTITDFSTTSITEYIDMADRSLYKAKSSGRNCVRY